MHPSPNHVLLGMQALIVAVAVAVPVIVAVAVPVIVAVAVAVAMPVTVVVATEVPPTGPMGVTGAVTVVVAVIPELAEDLTEEAPRSLTNQRSEAEQDQPKEASPLQESGIVFESDRKHPTPHFRPDQIDDQA